MDIEYLMKLVRERRTIRSFRPEPIPDEYVEKILEVSRWAPSGANSQPWEFVVVRDKEIKDKIVRFYKETRVYTRRMELTREEAKRHPGVARPVKDPRFRKAPVFIIVCGDPRTEECYPLSVKREKTFNSSLASAVLYIHLAATALGLGSQWVSASGNPLMETQLKDLLGIPRIFEIYDMIAVGYPAERPKPRHHRKLSEIVHYERYDKKKSRTDADISDFIATVHKA